jgi:hypothetical protein
MTGAIGNGCPYGGAGKKNQRRIAFILLFRDATRHTRMEGNQVTSMLGLVSTHSNEGIFKDNVCIGDLRYPSNKDLT